MMRRLSFLKISKIQFILLLCTRHRQVLILLSRNLLGIPSSLLAGCVMEVVGINPPRPPNCCHVIRLIKPIERKRILPHVDYMDQEYL